MEVFCQCWNKYGYSKTLTKTVQMDNTKIKVTNALVEIIMERETTDVNSILLLADIFITPREGGEPYREKTHMQKAIRKITADIIKIEKDSIDLYKTKQLANVMYILTERSIHETVWEGVEDAPKVMQDMSTALFNLLSANRFTPEDNNSSLAGKKMVIPVDMQGFEWLAKTTDNLIMMMLVSSPPMNDMAA